MWGKQPEPRDPFSALAPRTLGEDQPDADRPQLQARQALSDQIGSPLFVANATVEQFRSDFYHNVETTNVEVALAAKPDLDIALAGWPDPRIFGAVDGFGDYVGQELAKATQELLVERVVIGHIDEGH